jgi:hypothetical protein
MAERLPVRKTPAVDSVHSRMESRQARWVSVRLLRVYQADPSQPLTLDGSRWVFAAIACAAWAVLSLAIWMSARLRPGSALYIGALFVHLASLVLGFGAVLVADYFVVLWLVGRSTLAETVHVAARLHLPIWIGVIGLVLSGMLLEPNLAAGTTRVKLALVAILALNGLQALVLSKRMEGLASALSVQLLTWGAATTAVSQVCWWGSLWIGFWTAVHRHLTRLTQGREVMG